MIVALRQRREQRGHTVRAQQLRRIRWQLTGRNHVQPVDGSPDDRLVYARLACQDRRETGALNDVEQPVYAPLAQVRIDENRAVSLLRQRYGEIRGRGRFALHRGGRCDQDRAAWCHREAEA